MGDGAQQVTSDTKEILHKSVHRQEALRVGGRFEPSHLPLALPRRLMRAFRSIVLVSGGAVHHRRHGPAVGSRIAAKLVRDQSSRLTALPFQQLTEKARGGTPIAPELDEDVDHVTVLVNGTPQILPLALDVHEQLVQEPGVAASGRTPDRMSDTTAEWSRRTR